MHWMSILGFCLLTLGGVFSFLGTHISDKNSGEQLTSIIKEKNTTIENINSSNTVLIDQNFELLNSNKHVSVSNNELIKQNQQMIAKVSQYQNEVEQKNIKIEELEEKVKQVQKGITSKIDFNGTKRIKKGGTLTVTAGEEYSSFNKMLEFDNKRDYESLLDICNEYIKKVPEWYTSYFFKAIALLNINDSINKQQALDLFDFVSRNTIGDIEYAISLIKILQKMKDNNRIDTILNKISVDEIQAIEDKSSRDMLMKFKK